MEDCFRYKDGKCILDCSDCNLKAEDRYTCLNYKRYMKSLQELESREEKHRTSTHTLEELKHMAITMKVWDPTGKITLPRRYIVEHMQNRSITCDEAHYIASLFDIEDEKWSRFGNGGKGANED